MSAVVSSFTPTPLPDAKVIVIVGGGFCGTVLAIQLLRRPPATATRIVLIERHHTVGRGVAYAANSFPYLLNVPAARMSINPHDPLEFLSFARRKLPAATADAFLPRALYGEYLQAALRDAEQAAAAHLTVERIHGEARRLTASQVTQANDLAINTPLCIELDTGRTLYAHDVVLATGNPSPAILPGATELADHPAYVGSPWSLARNFTADQTVLIVGTGLTMADLVMKLTDDEIRMPTIHAISRRGLLPLQHARSQPSTDLQEEFDALLWSATSVRRLLRATRRLAHTLEQRGSNWRELITHIRSVAPRLWQRLPLLERRRFTRHLQCYWDICRHLLPAAASEHLQFVKERNKLHTHAGRIQAMRAEGERIRVRWQARGSNEANELIVDAVINATGPDYRVERSRDPLFQALHRDGLIASDPVGLGIRTGANGVVIDSYGKRNPHLFYLGPLLRANNWETTAAAELCVYAERLAAHLAAVHE
jgi:uncharacterized NAD(P)/FAD-binding protein YdhS